MAYLCRFSAIFSRFSETSDNTTYTFTMPAQDVTVSAEFEKNTATVKLAAAADGKYTVTLNEDDNVDETTGVTVEKGTAVPIKIEPSEGYELENVTVSGGTLTDTFSADTDKEGYEGTLTAAGDVTITVTAKALPYDRPAPEGATNAAAITYTETAVDETNNRSVYKPTTTGTQAISFNRTGYTTLDFDFKVTQNTSGGFFTISLGKDGEVKNSVMPLTIRDRLDDNGSHSIWLNKKKDGSAYAEFANGSMKEAIAKQYDKWYNMTITTVPGKDTVIYTLKNVDADGKTVGEVVQSSTETGSWRTGAADAINAVKIDDAGVDIALDNVWVYDAKTYGATVTVTEEGSDDPVVGAKVTLNDVSGATATTADGGVATFTNLLPGEYTATVEYTEGGYKTATGTVTVDDDTNELSVQVTKAELLTLTVKFEDGDGTPIGTQKTTQGFEGDTVTVMLNKVIEDNSKYYTLNDSQPGVTGYKLSHELVSGTNEVTVKYTEDDTIVYYAEAEDLNASGATEDENYSGGKYNGLGEQGHADTGITEDGNYTLITNIIKTGTHGVCLRVAAADDKDTLKAASPVASTTGLGDKTVEFTITGNTDNHHLYITGVDREKGGTNIVDPFDYVLIKKKNG